MSPKRDLATLVVTVDGGKRQETSPSHLLPISSSFPSHLLLICFSFSPHDTHKHIKALHRWENNGVGIGGKDSGPGTEIKPGVGKVSVPQE